MENKMSNKYLLKVAAIAQRDRLQLLSPERKKEIAQTGVLVGSGVGISAALDRYVKPRMKFSGPLGKAKYIGLIGGANLATDYAAVKINKAIEHARTN